MLEGLEGDLIDTLSGVASNKKAINIMLMAFAL